MSNRRNPEAVLSGMLATGWVPVYHATDPGIMKKILKACHAAGVMHFEFTDRSADAVSVFRMLGEYTERELPGMVLGAGSITDTGKAGEYREMGAAFIVSPILDRSLSDWARREEMLYIPGCGTATEMFTAMKQGAPMVKFFPAGPLGADYLRAVLAPLPDLVVMPTGGIGTDRESMTEWINAGAQCLGLGSGLFRDSDRQTESQLTQRFRDISGVINELKSK